MLGQRHVVEGDGDPVVGHARTGYEAGDAHADSARPRPTVTPLRHIAAMTSQLVLVDTPHDWRLDDRTRELGRRGVRQARLALGRPAVEPPEVGPPVATAPPGASLDLRSADGGRRGRPAA